MPLNLKSEFQTENYDFKNIDLLRYKSLCQFYERICDHSRKLEETLIDYI